MVLLESEQFLTELTRLFQKCRSSGSVFITLKKYDGRTKPIPRKSSVEGLEPAENKCLLRATDGKRKISTVVSSKEVNKFQMKRNKPLPTRFNGSSGDSCCLLTSLEDRWAELWHQRSSVDKIFRNHQDLTLERMK
ncbi:signal recognition particle 14 kDa protein isoform X2 [Arvicanthis niloticus]|uniref:signal recognition particle 14 kDa protein isoform X2 n=1 Tax=Arvicanthis niloticus TaxID=61156 RepID=UPI00402B4F5C